MLNGNSTSSTATEPPPASAETTVMVPLSAVDDITIPTTTTEPATTTSSSTSTSTTARPVPKTKPPVQPATVQAGEAIDLIRHYWPDDSEEQALRIVRCESDFYAANISHNRNGTEDWGLFQINSIHHKRAAAMGYTYLLDPIQNIKFALVIYDESGWRPWTCRRAL